MTDFDDRDIKIFGSKNEKEDTESMIKLVEEMAEQRANGNTHKAQILGENIAQLIFNTDAIDHPGFKKLLNDACVNEKVLYQIRMLLTFTAESTLHRCLNIASLSAIAVNSMYDSLIALDADFYENTTDAFTFYYVALRKGSGIPERIGKRFAMLCADETNENYKRIGTGLYLILCEIICDKISDADFTR